MNPELYYALELYPEKPMVQINGFLHPDGRTYSFDSAQRRDEFIRARANTKKISAYQAEMLTRLNPITHKGAYHEKIISE